MKQDEEKELVLGNKQLLSLFFVAAVLCGICFALGYMMGRNATKALPATDGSTVGAVDGRRPQPDGAIDSTPSTEPPAAVTETRPAQESAPTASEPPVVAPTVDAKPVEPKPLPPEPKAYESPVRKASADPLPASSPEPGASYLQVAAVPRPNAEEMVKTLREQHFPVIMAISPKPGFYRVLVGPYHQTVQLSDAKTKLKALGFNGAFVQKQ
jgi:cell division septation protein DedD